MSFDPRQPNYYPPPDPDARAAYVRERAQFPAVFLIMVGVVNLLGTLLIVVNVVVTASQSRDRFIEAMEQSEKLMPGLWQTAQKDGVTPEKLQSQVVTTGTVIATIIGVAGLLIVLGGIRMLMLRSYGLAVFAAIVAAIPCVSCSGCCMLGEIAGIWALFVLLDDEVRAAFS